jgi:hypothetical protein
VLWLPLLPSADEIMQPGCLSFCRQVAGFDNWPAKGLIKPPYKPAAERLVEGKAAYRAWLQSAEGAGCTYVLPDTDDEEDDDDEDTKGGKGKKKKVAAKKQQAKPKKQKTDPKPEKKETKKKQQKKTTATTRKDNVKVEVVPVETAGEVVGMDGAGGAGGDDDDDESESESGEDADEFEVSEILAERVGKRGKLEYRYVQYRTVQDRTGQDRTGQDRTGQDRTGQDRTGQDRTGQDRTVQYSTCLLRPRSAPLLLWLLRLLRLLLPPRSDLCN